MQPLFIGSHPAIDFLNTAFAPDGRAVETIADGRALLDWLVEAQIVDQAGADRLQRRLGGKGLDEAAAEARKLREWARNWIERWRSAPRRDYGDEIAALNKLLARDIRRREVVKTKEGLKVVERTGIDNTGALLALLAAHLAELVTQEDPALVKHCAGQGCTLLFLDRTKAHRRLYCSAAACGNRAKVAAFRERQRG